MAHLIDRRGDAALRWDRDDLIRRLCHALDIADMAIQHLASAGFREGDDSASHVRAEKPIAETAVLLYAAAVADHHPEVKSRIDRVARALVSHARSPSMRLGVALNPALALDYSIGHILLTSLGYPDPSFEHLLKRCWTAQAQGSRERTPHRALEQEWIAHVWGGAENARGDKPGSMRRCLLRQPLDLFGSSDEDLYAFTHSVMYLSGFRSNGTRLPRSRGVILAEAEAALARCLDAQDYDLAGEILLAWPLTGKTWSRLAAFGFRVLADVEDRAGFLPTPATRVEELRQRKGADRQRYLLATSYHTAYVMGLLCAAALQAGCAPPVRTPRPSVVRRAARQMLALLEQSGPRPHWCDTFDRLDPVEAHGLAGLLFNIALQRKAAQRDFDGLSEVLRVGYDLGLAVTPAASQAAELIERIGICAQTLTGASADARQAPIRAIAIA